jgi:hypothetical protein
MGERNRSFYRRPQRYSRGGPPANIEKALIVFLGFVISCVFLIAFPPLGLLILIGLVVVFARMFSNSGQISVHKDQPKNPHPMEQEKTEPSSIKGQTRHEEGIEFERYVAQLFDTKCFTIEDWTRDNWIKTSGFYVESNTNPDFTIRHNPTQERFAVECKWRSSSYYSALYNEKVFKVAKEEQLPRYRQFSENKGIPVFMVLGAGGKPNKPLEIYCVPLNDIPSIEMPISSLIPFKRSSTTDYFIWGNGILK